MSASETLDRHEQSSLRNNIRIFGVPMPSNEKGADDLVLRLFSEKLQVNVFQEYIDRSHRIRGGSNSQVFDVPYSRRCVVMANKKGLKSSGISLSA